MTLESKNMIGELFERNFKPYFDNGVQVAKIDRSYPPEILVVLSCGYTQKIGCTMDDKNAVARCKEMKENNIPSLGKNKRQ